MLVTCNVSPDGQIPTASGVDFTVKDRPQLRDCIGRCHEVLRKGPKLLIRPFDIKKQMREHFPDRAAVFEIDFDRLKAHPQIP